MVPGTGTEPVPVPNLPNRVQFRYRLLRFSVPVWYGTGSIMVILLRFSVPVWYGTGSIMVFTSFYPQIPVPNRTGYIRYRYPFLRIFNTGRYRAHP
ncbi:hypothetical protein HanRHA438_Chr15g0731271 [Helianthus annuus]|nr:hypothetical protein HanRHA438_Chr15g0731271 [Helianthus annuus]